MKDVIDCPNCGGNLFKDVNNYDDYICDCGAKLGFFDGVLDLNEVEKE